jgi:CRP-like cAMP-binding protein
MTCSHFAEGQVLFREGDPADGVFRLLSGSVDILRELDGEPILLGTVGAGQIIREMGVVENRCRSATARAASEVEAEFLTPTEFLDQIADSPQAARELIRRLSQRLHSGSLICRSSLGGRLRQATGCRGCSQTSSSMIVSRRCLQARHYLGLTHRREAPDEGRN